MRWISLSIARSASVDHANDTNSCSHQRPLEIWQQTPSKGQAKVRQSLALELTRSPEHGQPQAAQDDGLWPGSGSGFRAGRSCSESQRRRGLDERAAQYEGVSNILSIPNSNNCEHDSAQDRPCQCHFERCWSGMVQLTVYGLHDHATGAVTYQA